jgi:hypothetical protein
LLTYTPIKKESGLKQYYPIIFTWVGLDVQTGLGGCFGVTSSRVSIASSKSMVLHLLYVCNHYHYTCVFKLFYFMYLAVRHKIMEYNNVIQKQKYIIKNAFLSLLKK